MTRAMQTHTMSRKQFLFSLVGLGAGTLVLACGNDGETQPGVDANAGGMPDGAKPPVDAPPVDAAVADAPAQTGCAGTMAMIGTNHGHAIDVPASDVTAGVEKTYNIKGTSLHPHTVVVTAAMFAMLEAGQQVTATSSNDANHTHTVTLRCV